MHVTRRPAPAKTIWYVRHGYDSYLLGDTFHLQLNDGMWEDLYELHRWGNVISILKGSPFHTYLDCVDGKDDFVKNQPYKCLLKPACR